MGGPLPVGVYGGIGRGSSLFGTSAGATSRLTGKPSA